MPQEIAQETVHQVSYINEHGEFTMSAQFTRAQAANFIANNLFVHDSWGKIREVRIVDTGEPINYGPEEGEVSARP